MPVVWCRKVEKMDLGVGGGYEVKFHSYHKL